MDSEVRSVQLAFLQFNSFFFEFFWCKVVSSYKF
jgi:hypothetical protein